MPDFRSCDSKCVKNIESPHSRLKLLEFFIVDDEAFKRYIVVLFGKRLQFHGHSLLYSVACNLSAEMKIVHIITRLIVGGAQENTLLSCQGQHDRGHDVTLITGPPIGPEGSLMERAISHGYRVEVIDEMRRS